VSDAIQNNQHTLGGTLTENINRPRTEQPIDLVTDRSRPREVECLETEVLAEAYFRYEQLTLRTETFAGTLSPPYKREVLRSGRAVVVLLYDPVAQELILIEQFRIGAYVNHLPSAWILECVAGLVDEGETNEATARREAKEETGCDVRRLEFAGSYLSSPGLSDELVSIYVGEVDAAQAGGVHGHVAEGEDIRTVIFSVEEALAAADHGAVVNIMAQVALLWFARHGEALRRRWLDPVTRS
jgi:ADP-ribose pyrophosphatase